MGRTEAKRVWPEREENMRSVAQYLAACLDVVGPLPPLAMDLSSAIGCVLAQDLAARTDLPQRNLAAVDGYALRTEDLDGLCLPAHLPVVEDLGVGVDEQVYMVAGTAIRLAAGAPVPVDADMVVPLEYTDCDQAQVLISRLPGTSNIHYQAEDVAAGDLLMKAGERVGARQVSLLASCGYGRLPVHPAPRVVVVTTGSELVAPGEALLGGKVYDANSHALANGIKDAGALVHRVSGVNDDALALRDLLNNQQLLADLIITTGGLGNGPNDCVKEALAPLGTVRFDKVAMAPGRQFGVGKLEKGVPIFCLPGNPLEALIAFEVFVRPALRKMAGRSRIHRLSVRAQVNGQWSKTTGMRQFVPVFVTGDHQGYQLQPVGDPESYQLSAFARANALAVVPEDISTVRPGDQLPVLLLDR